MTSITQTAIDYAQEEILKAGNDNAQLIDSLLRAQGALEMASLIEDNERLYLEKGRIGNQLVKAKRGNGGSIAYPYDDFHGSWGDDDY